MSPRVIRDVDALKLGFLADGVLQALKASTKGAVNERHFAWMQQGIELLTSLAAGVGPISTNTDRQLQFGSLTSFPFAAEALRNVGTSTISSGLRSYFGVLAGTLAQLCNGTVVSDIEISQVRDFFNAIAETTLDSWSATQSPTIVGPERISWRMS